MAVYDDTQLEKLQARIPGATTAELRACLDDAADAIINRRFPFAKTDCMLEDRFYGLQIRLAVVLYNKIGAEGEHEHSEAGIKRTYESPDTLLKEVTPLGAVR